MLNHKPLHLIIPFALAIFGAFILLPSHVTGEVAPITEMEDKLKNISEEEKEVLGKLFTITQKIEEMELEEARITEEINQLMIDIHNIELRIEEKQADYDQQLDIMEQFLVLYQRGGPASYLEILLNANDLTTFLKSINMIKDISKNVNELLESIEIAKQVLEEEKLNLEESLLVLEQKKEELQEPIRRQKELKKEQEDYLASLQENKIYYEQQLRNLEQLWADNQVIFSEIVYEISKIVGEGYFETSDLNLTFSFTGIRGHIKEETFNQMLQERSTLPETVFTFLPDKILIKVPEKHLELSGNFTMVEDSTVNFIAEEGTFYDMPLEKSSLEELFREGPLVINFKKMAEGNVIIDFSVTKVESQEGALTFEIKPIF
ncbi:MAG: hypothetical protein GX306_03450 [Clostridiales bacterium]|nr:hypothetical protein [Clostridiales bacterium]